MKKNILIFLHRTIDDLKKILEKNIQKYLKIDFSKKKIIKTFGLFLKIKKNQE